MSFAPWAKGSARRIDEDTIVGTFAVKAEWADWYLAEWHVDDEGQFVTTTFRRRTDDEESRPMGEAAVDWREELAKADTLEEAIGLSIGAASACWSNLGGAGVFESERASAITEALLDLVRGYVR